MSNIYAPVGEGGSPLLDYDYDDAHGQGLVTFAGVMLLIAATLNVLYGIASIDKANLFTHNARYVFGDLQTWGWFLLVLGVAQAFAAFGIWRGTSWARWFGVACASVNAILQTVWIPSYPVLAMTMLTLDVIIIYALLAYAGNRKRYAQQKAASS